MSTQSTHSLKTVVGPSTRVIIWVSQEFFDKSNDLYNEFNYLFDGLFSRRNSEQKVSKGQTDLFTAMSFGKKLCLYRVHPDKVKDITSEIQKKTQEGINTHTLLAIDTNLEASFYKISKEFENIANLEIHLTKDLVE